MKNKFAVAILMCLTFIGVARSQAISAAVKSLPAKLSPLNIPGTRFLAGVSGGDNLGNKFLGVSASLEIPIKTRAEFDLKDEFDPFESHVILGTGWANVGEVQAILWTGRNWGLVGSYESSIYSVPSITKSYLYGKGGFIFRHTLLGKPARIEAQYFQELDNGIKNGTETDHVLGGVVIVEVRLGCIGNVCVRGVEQLLYARALTQGNPVCDGSTPGVANTCPRGSVLSAGASGSIRFEFGRHGGF